MTVTELRETLEVIESQGCGEENVAAWNPDAGRWETVTKLTYGKRQYTRLHR